MKNGLILVPLLSFCVGCGGVSKADFDQVEMGMTQDQVTSLLGAGEEVLGPDRDTGVSLPNAEEKAKMGLASRRYFKWISWPDWLLVTFDGDEVVAVGQGKLPED